MRVYISNNYISAMIPVFFKVSEVQEKEVKELMKQEGYTNKSEFFRFLIKFFKYHKTPIELKIEQETQKISKILMELKKQGKLNKSLDEQLKDV